MTTSNNENLRIIRISEVATKRGVSRTTLYRQIKDGLLTKPVNLGAHSIGWPEHEVDKLNGALIAGATSEQLKELVQSLTEQRQQLMCA
ncbi:helix-turn-helix transcriptional regulator [Thalassotalea montiporae]